MRYTRPILLCCQLACGLLLLGKGAIAAGLPLEQEIQAGRGFVNAFAEQYGVSDNQKYRELADSVLTRLVDACGERPELHWRISVLKYNANNPVGKNASAWPGGFIVTDEEFLKTLDTAANGEGERLQALLAGVLSHEMAHVVRHDTDALVPLFFKQADAAPPQLLFALKSPGNGSKTDAAVQRKQENECDRSGAFYLLRAGYRIEDMINVFRRLADEEVDEVLFSSDLDHARAAERVGNILDVKGQVLEDERLYDEATNILRLGLGDTLLQVAADNLDTVARHFPKMLSVRHARAVLAHRRYLAKVTPQKLKYKPSFAFYRFRMTRAFADDYLQQALREYAAILKDYEAVGYQGMGPTVSAYALALSQAGQTEKALSWAQQGVQLAPQDWNAYNVLGIALHQSGKVADAANALRKAVALASPEGPKTLVARSLTTTATEERAVWRYVDAQKPVEFGAALYNLGGVLKGARDVPGAVQAFRAYLATDAQSDWGQSALSSLKELGIRSVTETSRLPVAGVTVGLTDTELRKKMGDPEAIAEAGPDAQVWRYKKKGLSLFLDASNRVRAGLLYAPCGAEIGARVKLGAAAAQVEKTWGKPWVRLQERDREAWGYPTQGLTFLMNRGRLEKVVWSPAPPAGGAAIEASLQISPGDTAEQVKQLLGAPESGEDPGRSEGMWAYDRLGLRIRFDRQGTVALVTVTRPSSATVGGVKLGDAPTRIRTLVGAGYVTREADNSETYSFPDRGIAYVVRNAAVSVITLFSKQG